jgi:hypothetical protein
MGIDTKGQLCQSFGKIFSIRHNVECRLARATVPLFLTLNSVYENRLICG